MKKCIFIALCVFLPVLGTAQTGQEKKSVFHLSFIPPMSTHGSEAGDYSNRVSLNILAGISANEQAFTFGGLVNIVRNNVQGFQFAGLYNYVGQDGRGLMFGGLGNTVGNDYSGFQFGGLVNTVRKDMRGFQFAGLYNYAGQDGRGLMFGGLGNTVGNDYSGFQLGGLFNTTERMNGFQFAGLINRSGRVNGFQFGGLGNIAGEVNGFQFGGIFNVAGKVRGVQLAGLVNVAESSDYPLAILNIIKKGEYGLGLVCDEKGSVLAELRSGGRVTYGILGVGYNFKADGEGFTTEAGLGARACISRLFRIHFEIKGGSIGNFSEDVTFYTNFGVLPAIRLFSSHIDIFAGPTLNYMCSENPGMMGLFPGNHLFRKVSGDRKEQIFIGGQAGIQYIF